MKHIWPEYELADYFTLSNEELNLLTGKTASSRIGIAVLLKFFQFKGRFPRSRKQVPKKIISHLANQLEIPIKAFDAYNWQGRSIRTHRTQLLQFIDFSELSRNYLDDLVTWLQDNCLPGHFRLEQLEVVAIGRLQQIKYVPSRLIRHLRLPHPCRSVKRGACFC